MLAIEAPCITDSKKQYNSIEKMASDYIKAIKTCQPDGPYSIGGWSMGGVVAFEMAKQLREKNELINDLYLIDSRAPQNPKITLMGADDQAVLGALTLSLGGTINNIKQFAACPNIDSALNALLMLVITETNTYKNLTFTTLKQRFETIRSHAMCLNTYKPIKQNLTVHLFLAGQVSTSSEQDLSLGWKGLTNTLDTVVLDANHESIVVGENAAKVAKHILTHMLDNNKNILT